MTSERASENAHTRLMYQERARADFDRLHRFMATSNQGERAQLTNPDEYIPGVVEITMALFPKSPEIHAILLHYLTEQGYEVKDLTSEEERQKSYSRKPSAETMRDEGWSTGHARLKEDVLQRVGKCGSCKEYISVIGIRTHNHQCEKCGEVTHQDLAKGSQVSIRWWESPQNVVSYKKLEDGEIVTTPLDGDLLMRGGSLVVEKYDSESGLAYCYGEMDEIKREGIDVGSKAEELYRNLADKGHIDRIIIPRDQVSDLFGSRSNYRIVKLYQGKEYSEYEDLPIAESFSIYEPWLWAPAEPSPILHEQIIEAAGMVSRKDYYYQDGRAAFYEVHLDRMRRFVDHFTTFDLNKWDALMQRADKSGPGMIDAVAHFIHKSPVVRDEPNIGNALVGLADSLAGKPKTRRQIEAEIKYMRTEGFDGSMDDLIKIMRDSGSIPTEEDKRKAKEQKDWIQGIWDSLSNT